MVGVFYCPKTHIFSLKYLSGRFGHNFKGEKMTVENRTFKLHPDILWSIIQAQAGTLGKAILELVMNSIDAGATKVDIKLSGKKVSVADDGKGFVSRKEIEEFFETFGTPHTAGDATYGRFRMGRGQVFAFTVSHWKSGEFAMSVDIKNKGLNYDLSLLPKPVKGCSIEGDLYECLKPSEVLAITDSIRDLCKYAPVPVFINGERVSIELTKHKWTMEDDDAYYLIREKATQLEVYNLGVHVRNYSQSEFGIGGIVVSKQQLDVNFARNDILVSKCEVWKRVAPKLRAYAKKDQAKAPVQNEGYRKLSMTKILSANYDTGLDFIEALENKKIFTDVSGKHYSFDKLRGAISNFNGNIVSLEKDRTMADKVQQRGLALVLAPVTLERANFMSLTDILNRIKNNLSAFESDSSVSGWSVRHRKEYVDFILQGLVSLDSVAQSISEDHELVDEKSLNKEEKLVLKTIRENDWCFGRIARELSEKEWGVKLAGARNSEQRKIVVCESETVDAYTNGNSMIALNRNLLKIYGGAGGAFESFDKIKGIMMHEYCHDSDDSTGHGHPAEFYAKFHEAMTHKSIHSFLYQALKFYLNARRKAGMTMRAGELFAMDVLATEFDEEVVEETVEAGRNVVSLKVESTTEANALPEQLELAAFTKK